MPCFELLTDRIYRLKVPFENIYTAVFLIKCARGYMLVDAATTKYDVETVILPAIEELGIQKDEITHILITHPHGDHAGGLRYLLPHLPQAVVCAGSDFIRDRLAPQHYLRVSDGMEIDDGIVAVSLPGHCPDMTGYMDERSKSIITGDAVQICGVGRYGCGLGSFIEYFSTLDKLGGMDIDTIIASHDYYPLGAIAEEKEETKEYLRESREYARYIMRIADEHASRGISDERVITDFIREKNLNYNEDLPPLQYSSVRAYLNEKKHP